MIRRPFMKRKIFPENIIRVTFFIAAIFISAEICLGLGTDSGNSNSAGQEYARWQAIGRSAAYNAFAAMKKADAKPEKGNIIVLTNSGYAEVNSATTQGALDGLSYVTGAARGNNTLIEIHSSPWTKLWFAVYDRKSGLCSYMEVSLSSSGDVVFDIQALEQINFDHLSSHAEEYKAKFDKKVFGGNEFRVVSIVNAIVEEAPSCAVRAFEFHDHFCPGVTSGIMMASWLKKHFAPESGADYFIQAIQPWCKEDAMMALLNATPGKGSYSVNYPSDADLRNLLPWAKDASTAAYRKKKDGKSWEGIVLAFKWATEIQCPDTGNGIVDKVCADLWYLKRVEKPEEFVSVVKSFELPEGASPKDWAAPGVDPMEKLSLIKQ
jgi:formylmethanofuran dehydrogenase subunit E-like metal-binding protein